MSEIIRMEISLPADNDGFILFQCPLCEEYFKLCGDEIKADDTLEIWCPCCGLISDSYLTEDVVELAQTMALNVANNLLFQEMKKWERQIKGKGVSFKAGKQPESKAETPIQSLIEALEIVRFSCCKKEAKVKPLVKICGCYCPYCGVRYDGN